MNNIFRTIFLLKSLSTGLMLPIMSLMIISRGAGTELLPLVIGVYSLTVILFEFPSGVFSDIFGRKKTFLISCSLMLLSLFLLSWKHPMFLFCFWHLLFREQEEPFPPAVWMLLCWKKVFFQEGTLPQPKQAVNWALLKAWELLSEVFLQDFLEISALPVLPIFL